MADDIAEIRQYAASKTTVERLKAEIAAVKPPDVSINEALEFRRDQYGLKQYEFARLLGMTPTHYSDMMAGRRRITKEAIRRAFALGVPIEVLLQPNKKAKA